MIQLSKFTFGTLTKHLYGYIIKIIFLSGLKLLGPALDTIDTCNSTGC